MSVFDFYARRAIQSDILSARDDSRRAETAIDELEARVHVLEQSLEALWSLLKDKAGLADEELTEHAKQRAEAAPSPGTCPACGRRLLVRHAATCSWCGHRLDPNLLIGGPADGAQPPEPSHREEAAE